MERRFSVLIVDNDPDRLFAMRSRFEGEGFDVILAADGASALQRIEAYRPDAVVLDVSMPVLDGWFVLAELAGVVEAPPVVVISAKGHPLDVARARALGACDYVVKPGDDAVLVERVRRASDQYAVVA